MSMMTKEKLQEWANELAEEAMNGWSSDGISDEARKAIRTKALINKLLDVYHARERDKGDILAAIRAIKEGRYGSAIEELEYLAIPRNL